ncbi:MAG: mechanosensitive ion channel family protein [Euryarchaeota archaeon]|nr:mechanosensitive ion channel family protein [Euryarchaeota archaeon]
MFQLPGVLPGSLQPFERLLWPSLAIVLFLLGGLVTRRVLDRTVVRWAAQSRFKFDDIILQAVRGPLVLWFLLGGIFMAQEVAGLDPGISRVFGILIPVLLSLSVVAVAAKIATGLVQTYGDRSPAFRPLQSISQRILKMLIWFVGLMFVLNAGGVSITPLLASFGIAGLAVALALQETLGNFFSGFWITAERPIRIGDYIKLDSGVEGYVTDIGWRTTRIRSLPNNLIIVPNSKLAQSIITNYHLPEPEMAALVQVSVAYSTDLARAEQVVVEVAREVQKQVQGAVPTHEPFIRYHTLGDSGIGFSVILRVQQFVDQYLVTHEFIKRLHARFARESIEIPFPQRVVHLRDKSA